MKKPQTFKYTDEVDKSVKKLVDEYSDLWELKTYKKGSELLTTGEIITKNFYVESGIIKASVYSPLAKGEAILTFFGDGSCILPYRSDNPENATVLATFEVIKNAKIRSIYKDNWDKIHKDNPQRMSVIMQQLTLQTYNRYIVQAIVNTYPTAKERYKIWAEIYPFLRELSAEDVAARIGLDDSTVKRVK